VTLSFSDALKEPVAQRQVYAKCLFRKHFFGWILFDTGIYSAESSWSVIALNEDEEACTAATDYSDLETIDTSLVGAFFYDESQKTLFYKPLDGTTAFAHFCVGAIAIYVAIYADTDDDEIFYVPSLTTVPTFTLSTSDAFQNNVSQNSTGSVSLVGLTPGALFPSLDLEPDGHIELSETVYTVLQ